MTATPGDQSARTYVLRPTLPVPPLVVAALAALGGAVLLVLGRAASPPAAVVVAGVVLLVLGVLLMALALASLLLLRQTVVLDDRSITVRRRLGARTLAWSEVTEVQLSGQLLRLTTGEGTRGRLTVADPGGAAEPAFIQLVEAIRQRLDADRGYRPFE